MAIGTTTAKKNYKLPDDSPGRKVEAFYLSLYSRTGFIRSLFMKKLLLALAILTGGTAHAQITYETRYGAALQVFKLSTGQVKYIGYFPNSNSFRIYNNDNSLYKIITLPYSTTYAYDSFLYLSDRLFNSDSKLEFATSIQIGDNYTMKVLNEDGVQLFSQDSCTNIQIHSTPLGTKMFTYIYRPMRTGYLKVYSLPGTNTTLGARITTSDVISQPYPNPTQAEIQLPYRINTGQVGLLTITNIAGQQVASYKIDSTFDYLKINTNSFAKGIYLYQVDTEGQHSTSKRFLVE